MDKALPVVTYETGRRLNTRKLDVVEPDQVLQGNIKALDLIMEELAYVDVRKDGNCCQLELIKHILDLIRSNPEAHSVYALCQFNLQYLLYSIAMIKQNNNQIEQYIEEQNKKTQNVQELLYQQKRKLNELKQQKRLLSDQEVVYRKLTNKIHVQQILAGEANQDDLEEDIEESKVLREARRDLTPERGRQRGKLFQDQQPKPIIGDDQSVLQNSQVTPVEELKQKYALLNSLQKDELRKLLFQESIQNPASLSKVIKDDGQESKEIDLGATIRRVPNESGGVLNDLSTITTQRIPVSSVVRESDDLVRHKEVKEEEEEYRGFFELTESKDLATTKKLAVDFTKSRNINPQQGVMNNRNLQGMDQFLQNKQKADDISIEEFKL